MYLHDQTTLHLLLTNHAINPNHRAFDNIGGRTLNRIIDGIPLSKGEDVAITALYIRNWQSSTEDSSHIAKLLRLFNARIKVCYSAIMPLFIGIDKILSGFARYAK